MSKPDHFQEELINPFAAPTEEEEQLVPAEPVWPLHPTSIATITPLPEQYRGHVFNTTHLLLINVCGFSPMFGFFGGLGLLFLCYNFPAFGFDPVFTFALAAIGVLCLVISSIIAFFYPLLLEDLFTQWRFKSAVRLRHDPLIQADDQDAVMIGLTPRENWKQVKLDIANDYGLIKIDQQSSTILIESDLERFRIPLDSLFDCKTERFFHPMDAINEHWLICLVVQTESAPREILFGLCHTSLQFLTNKRKKLRAQKFCDQISEPHQAVVNVI